MTVTPAYIPAPGQSDQQAASRAQTLGVGVAPREVPPCYQPFVTFLPGVIAEYGQGNVVFLRDDGTLTAQQVTTAVAPLVAQQQADQTAAANAATLDQKAAAALANNLTFLNLASPTNAQTLVQVKALTRQVNALIRLGQGLVSDISDT